MNLDDIFDQVDKTELTTGTDYVKYHDAASMIVSEATFGTSENNNSPRAFWDVTLTLLTTATQNRPKSADYTGDVLKTRFYLPMPDMSEGERTVKAKILKEFCNNVGIETLKGKKGDAIANLMKGKQLKVVIGLDEAFYIDEKNNNKPVMTTYARYRWSKKITESLTADLGKLATPKPLTPNKLSEFNAKLEYWKANFGGETSAAQQASSQSFPEDDDFLSPQKGADDPLAGLM